MTTNQCDEGEAGVGGRRFSRFPPVEIKSEGREKGKGLNRREYRSPNFPTSDPGDEEALARFLAENPAMSPRDWKGKGFSEFAPFDKHYVGPNEKPWDELGRDEVRRAATSNKARFLSRSQRMAAARDPGLVWDETSRSYRLRPEATLAPPTTTGRAKHREGGGKVNGSADPRPATASEKTANLISTPRAARSRGLQGGAP